MWSSVRGGLHIRRRPRAVRAERRRTDAPEEVEVGRRGVGNLTDVGVQRGAAAPIHHEVTPAVRRQELGVLCGQFVQARGGGTGLVRLHSLGAPLIPGRAPQWRPRGRRLHSLLPGSAARAVTFVCRAAAGRRTKKGTGRGDHADKGCF